MAAAASLLLGLVVGLLSAPATALSERGADASASVGALTRSAPAQRQPYRPSLSGVAEVTLREGPDSSVTDSFSYRMLSDQESYAWPDGADGGGLQSGIGVIAIPVTAKNWERPLGTSNIAVTNVVPQPGFTRFVIFMADQNGMFDYVCEKLNESQTEYIDLAVWGYVSNGFVGSMTVSATYWEHDVVGIDGRLVRNALGLTAAAGNWSTFAGSHPALAMGMRSIPLDTNLGMALSPWDHSRRAVCPGGAPAPPNPTATPEHSPTPTLTPTVTPTPLDPPPYAFGAPEQHMPALRWRTADDACDAYIEIQNLGAEATKAILVGWGEPSTSCLDCRGPLAVECTGLIRSDGAWRLNLTQIHDVWRAAVAFSFTTRTLADIGVDPASHEMVADAMCAALWERLPGSCDEYERFKLAYDRGETYHGVPLDAGQGAPIAAQIDRTCESQVEGGLSIAGSYPSVGGPAVGFKGRAEASYQYGLPSAFGAVEGMTSVAHVQNAGSECSSFSVWALESASSAEPARCGAGEIAPGEARIVSIARCLQEGGTAWIESSGPLAVTVDSSAENAMSTYAGAPRQLRNMHGEPLLSGSGSMASAPLVYTNYFSWNTSLALQNTDEVSSVLKVSVIDRSGDAVSVRQLGPLAPRSGTTIDLAAMAGVPYDFVGWARVESFSFDDAPVATPWLGPEPTSTPRGTPGWNPYDRRVTRTPGSPVPVTPGTPGTPPTPRPTATATRTLVPRPTQTPFLPHEGWCGFPLIVK